MDAEHRALIKAINDICAACRAGHPPGAINPLLKILERQTEHHLGHENAVMHEIAASTKRSAQGEVKAMTRRAIEDHIAEHGRILKELRAIVGAARAAADCGATEICVELKRWFLDHAVKYDAHLKSIFQAI